MLTDYVSALGFRGTQRVQSSHKFILILKCDQLYTKNTNSKKLAFAEVGDIYTLILLHLIEFDIFYYNSFNMI